MQHSEIAIWQAQTWPATECFVLKPSLEGMLAESFITGMDDARNPFAIAYKIELTHEWRVKHVGIYSLLDVHKKLRLVSDFAGHWFDADRQQQFALDGCEFIDINLTPFTNTLPVKRLNLTETPQPVDTVFIDLPSFQVRRVQHFYSKTGETSYVFQDVTSQVKANIQVGSSGLVNQYEGYFTKV